MKNAWMVRPASVTALILSVLLVSFASSDAAQKVGETKARRPRLPNYVGRVVNEQQREEINQIQDEYGPKIQKLRDEIETLSAARDAAIDKVLTAQQRKEVERLRQEAASRRAGAEPTNTKTKQKSKS